MGEFAVDVLPVIGFIREFRSLEPVRVYPDPAAPCIFSVLFYCLSPYCLFPFSPLHRLYILPSFPPCAVSLQSRILSFLPALSAFCRPNLIPWKHHRTWEFDAVMSAVCTLPFTGMHLIKSGHGTVSCSVRWFANRACRTCRHGNPFPSMCVYGIGMHVWCFCPAPVCICNARAPCRRDKEYGIKESSQIRCIHVRSRLHAKARNFTCRGGRGRGSPYCTVVADVINGIMIVMSCMRDMILHGRPETSHIGICSGRTARLLSYIRHTLLS